MDNFNFNANYIWISKKALAKNADLLKDNFKWI